MVGPIFNGINYGVVGNDKKGLGVVAQRSDVTEPVDIVFEPDTLKGYSAIVLTVRVGFPSGATNPIRVEWLYSQDGQDYDTDGQAVAQKNYYDIQPESTTSESQVTLIVPIFTDYVMIRLTNQNTTGVDLKVWATLMG